MKHLWVAALFLIHFLIYRQHYQGTVSFPFDFGLTYFGFVAFWTTAIQSGVFPDWVPYQAMGYPLMMNPQAYFYYPPNWLFALSGIPYDGYSHTIMQCMHIFMGIVGFFFLARLIFSSQPLAFAGAAAYQFFGGYFSNSQHVDYIRAFSILPWIIWSLHIEPGRRNLCLRHYLFPFLIALTGLGVYPGAVVAFVFLSGVYLLTQLILSAYHRAVKREEACSVHFSPTIKLCALFALGVLLCTPQTYPSLIFGSETVRVGTAAEIVKRGWDLRLAHTLLFSWDRHEMPYDTTMTSLFVGLPVFVAACFCDRNIFRRLGAWLVVFAAAILLIPGNASAPYRALGQLIPTLLISRFPTADYRPVLCVFIIILCLSGIQRVRQIGLGSEFWNRLAIALALFMALVGGLTGIGPSDEEVLQALPHLAAIIILLLLAAHFRFGTSVFAVIFVTLVALDARRIILNVQQYWNAETQDEVLLRDFGLASTRDLPIAQRFGNPPTTRPARSEELKPKAWIGYLDGTFHTDDYTGLILWRRHHINTTPFLAEYMRLPWKPILISDLETCSNKESLAALINSAVEHPLNGKIVQTSYGVDTITYNIETLQSLSFIENEMYFPGWRGFLTDENGSFIELEAEECAGLRLWTIPHSGKLHMLAKFELPYSRLVAVGVGCLALIYLAILLNTAIKSIPGKVN